MSKIVVRPVQSASDRKQFIKFLWSVYNGSPSWVPPLIVDRKKLMDTKKNPFYRHADAEFYLAERNGSVVGRIAAIVNHNHNTEHDDTVGFFGFFECINDADVSAALFNRAKQFLLDRGMTVMRGPANPSVNDEYGLLVDGFDLPPTILMPYNPPYYIPLIESYGFRKAKDLYSYKLTQRTVYSEKLERVAKLVKDRHRITFRTMNMKSFDEEVQRIKYVFNKAWEKNWGAVQMTDDEVDAMAEGLKPIVEPELVIFAEVRGETIGFALSLPDINTVLKANRRGWLVPGIVRLLTQKKRIKSLRIIVLGVLPEYQSSGAAGVLFYETAKRSKRLGYEHGEAGWVLEDNTKMVQSAQLMNGELVKTYRIYDCPLER